MAADAIQTPIGLLAFPHLFTPKPRAEGKDPDYSCTLIFNKAAQETPQFKALRAAARKVAEEKWPKEEQRKGIRTPFRKGEEKSDKYDGYEPGDVFITAWSKFAPGVVDPSVQNIEVPSDVYAGQYARATIVPFAYEKSGNKGVGFMLNNVQITRMSAPRLDGKRNASDDFDLVEDESHGDDQHDHSSSNDTDDELGF